jgi:hypothetical protein
VKPRQLSISEQTKLKQLLKSNRFSDFVAALNMVHNPELIDISMGKVNVITKKD